MNKILLILFVILPVFGMSQDLVRWNGANLEPNALLILNNGTISSRPVSGNFVTDNYSQPFPGFRGSGYNTSNATPDENNFIGFQFTVVSGASIPLNDFRFTYARGDGGARRFEVRYSLDGSKWISKGTTNGVTTTPKSIIISLSDVSVPSGGTFFIRVYPYDRQNKDWAGGTFHIKHGTGFSTAIPDNSGPTISRASCTPSTSPTAITGNSTICAGASINLLATGGSEGTNNIYEWGTGEVSDANVIKNETKANLTHSPIQTTTYWVRRVSCNSRTSAIKKTVTVLPNLDVTKNEKLDKTQTVCSCTIEKNKTLTIEPNVTLTVINDITVEEGGKMIVQDKGSLVQLNDDATFTGSTDSFVMERKSQRVFKLDYIYWSSPLQLSNNFTIGALASNSSAAYQWNNAWIPVTKTTPMVPGKGYIVRAPDDFDFKVQNGNPKEKIATFKGIPNNGKITIAVNGNKNWNLIGNPYPSALDVEKFLIENRDNLGGTIYLWTHNTSITQDQVGTGYSYTASDYASYNFVGGTSTAPTLSEGMAAATGTGSTSANNDAVPQGYIASGQGFFVQGETSGIIDFNNAMRVQEAGKNDQFFRPELPQPVENWEMKGKHRIWLNLTGGTSAFNQVLVGYVENATNATDWGYDGAVFGGGAVSLYSIIEAKNYTIQGRALPFTEEDEVPLGYRTTLTGTLKISIDHVDGQFEKKDIYIQDKITGIVHNLRDSHYSFTTVPGTFNDRFVLRYLPQATLDTDTPVATGNSMVVYNVNNQINIKSTDLAIDQIVIYDLQGKTLFAKNNVNAQEFATQSLSAANQIVIVKVIMANNAELVKKVVLR